MATNVLEHLRNVNKYDLIDLVKMHLSFQIDVTCEEWEKIIAYVESEEESRDSESSNKQNHHKSAKTFHQSGKNSQTKYFTSTNSTISTESQKAINSKFGPPKEKELASNIFGNPLSIQSLKQAMILVDFLNEDENFNLEGIFRKSGTQERQQDLRYMLNNGVRVDLKANRFTPVDTSCVLKEFIQKLPEPLLTNNHFELHYELAVTIRQKTPEHELEEKNAKRLKVIQLLLHLLPELNRKFFFSLMELLNKVANARDVTKMDERSLATIFGQHILCPRSWTPKQVQKNIDVITDAMEFLLKNYDCLTTGPIELVADAKLKLNKYLMKQKQSSTNRNANISGGDSFDNNNLEKSMDHVDHAEEPGDENNTVVTFCQRKESHETITDEALAELYAQVQAMPETPRKRKLIKQFNKQNGIGTPMQVTKQATSNTSSKWKSFIPPILRPKH